MYSEQLAWATEVMISELPKNDPWRARLTIGDDVPGAHWRLLVDEYEDGSQRARHPDTGPVVLYPPLGRAYQVPFDPPRRVVVSQLSDADGEDGQPILDAASVYIAGRTAATLIEERPAADE